MFVEKIVRMLFTKKMHKYNYWNVDDMHVAFPRLCHPINLLYYTKYFLNMNSTWKWSFKVLNLP